MLEQGKSVRRRGSSSEACFMAFYFLQLRTLIHASPQLQFTTFLEKKNG